MVQLLRWGIKQRSLHACQETVPVRIRQVSGQLHHHLKPRRFMSSSAIFRPWFLSHSPKELLWFLPTHLHPILFQVSVFQPVVKEKNMHFLLRALPTAVPVTSNLMPLHNTEVQSHSAAGEPATGSLRPAVMFSAEAEGEICLCRERRAGSKHSATCHLSPHRGFDTCHIWMTSRQGLFLMCKTCNNNTNPALTRWDPRTQAETGNIWSCRYQAKVALNNRPLCVS